MTWAPLSNHLSLALSLALGLFLIALIWPREQPIVQRPAAEVTHANERKAPPPATPSFTLPPPPVAPAVVAQTEVSPPTVAGPKPAPAPSPTPSVAPVAPQPLPTVSPTASTVATPLQPAPIPEVKPTVADIQKGRTLLRVLEHGRGPGIEIAWPDGAAARERLFGLLDRCHGMKVAVLDELGNLFTLEQAPGQRWEINLDRYSGFLRQPSGQTARSEENLVRAIRRRHGLSGGTPVRIFPRHADAALLGGLEQRIGANYADSHQIRATYVLNGDRLRIDGLQVDGAPLPGRIDLGGCGRRS